MSNSEKSRELLKRYSIARIPFIAVNTIEPGRALAILQSIAEELMLPFCVHSSTKGVYDLASDKNLCEDKSIYGAIDYMTEQMKRKQYQTIILTEIPDLSLENAESKQILSLVNLANESGGVVIVFTNSPIWNQLQRQGMIIKLDLPNEDEMVSIIHNCMDDYRGEITIEWDDSDIRQAALLLNGVTAIEAENVIAALIANKSIKKSDMDEVRFAKDRLFADISGLERIEVDDSVKNVGGLQGLQRWLDEKRELLKPGKKDELTEKGLQPPRGILLVGVPGCGKSLSAKSISANWKLLLYRLDFATVQGKYVGQSEQQLRDALTTAENVSPCILWIDEIEKGLSGAMGDGGVSTRMVGQFLFWLQECKKQVFVVATANDVSMLPSELLRRGRFDELFFVDLPTEEERREIISLYMSKYLDLHFEGEFANKIVSISEGFTGADLESTIRDLAYRVIANPDFLLSKNNIVAAFENVVPLSQTSPERIARIRDWGKERAVPASGKPIGQQEIGERKNILRTRKVLV